MAIIQVKEGQTMTEEEVFEFCKEVKLAKYKWPRKIVFDKVMRNPTGKLMKPQMREKFTGRKEAFKKAGLRSRLHGGHGQSTCEDHGSLSFERRSTDKSFHFTGGVLLPCSPRRIEGFPP
jgi:hypothetical protein